MGLSKNGIKFKVGQKVLRPVVYGRSPELEVCEVTRVEDGKVYLDGSKVALRILGRIWILNT